MFSVEQIVETIDTETLEQYRKTGTLNTFLFVYFESGKREIVHVAEMCSIIGITPGQFIYELKPLIRQSPDIVATVFITEAWMSKTKMDDEISKKLQSGEMRVSELDVKDEILMITIESKNGFKKIIGHEIIRSEQDKNFVISDKNYFEGMNGMTGRVLGIFE